ncbi:G-D-S-L family lipolytic protein [Miniimonas arenae]|uniref:G-D-S-L family lipolytic protein n=1 Tax=Miniimonas arenae TaxID=676201 RepID=A0A5C5BEX1_9MICO|nr:G-D-S-L family lipolytic protein [Miniimonas arenae]
MAAGSSPVSRDRGAAVGDDVARDFLLATSWTFLVDLPNGTYDVTATSGDPTGSGTTKTTITLEGAAAGTLSAKAAVATGTYRTTVADGQLTVDLSGAGAGAYLNGLQVVAVSTPTPEPTTSPTATPTTEPTAQPTGTPTDPGYGSLPAPTSLRTAYVTDGSITLRWNEIAGATGYVLSRSDDVAGPYTEVASVGDQVWATDAVATDVVHYYRVQAKGADGLSAPSAAAVATLAGADVPDVELPDSGILSFDLGSGATAPGSIRLDATSAYSAEQRYGFVDVAQVSATDRGTDDAVRSDFVTVGDTELVVDLPNGDYTVDLVAGDAADVTNIAITAEQMAKVQATAKNAGEYLAMSFDIAIVDGQLNLELSGTAPKLNQLVVRQQSARTAGAEPTVWITGDSTVQSYTADYAPQAGWGQMIDRFLDDGVTVENKAIGGRSSKNFISQGRLDEVLRQIKPGDYLFVQFGHNDNSRGVDDRWAAPADYANYLRTFVDGARQRGAVPIVVTPVSRRDFNATTGKANVSFPAYVDAATALAQETDTPLVDLSATSRAYLDEIGPERAKSVFLHVPAGVYPGRPTGTTDDTHFQEYGAIQMARLVAGDVAELDIPLADHVVAAEAPSEAPLAPAGVLVGAVSDSSAQLTWTASPGTDVYSVYVREAGAGDDAYRLATTSTLPQALVAGLTRGTSYELVVVATNGAGDSPRSGVVAVTTKAPIRSFDFQLAGNVVQPGYLEVNQNTLYSASTGYGWTALPGPGGRDRGVAFTPVPTALERDFLLPGTGNTFVVDLPVGTYSVTAYSGDMIGTAQLGAVIEGVDYGTGRTGRNAVTTKLMQPVAVTDGQLTLVATGWLNGLEITPLQYAPTALVLDGVHVDGTQVAVDLSWQGAEGAASYRVLRQSVGATAPVTVGETTEASFTDTSADVGLECTYSVVALDAAGNASLATNTLAVTTVDPSIPTAATPSGLAVTKEEKNLVSLAWQPVDGALFYQVYRAESADGELELVGRASATSFDDTDVLTTIPYYYAVAAVNAGGVSERSATVASAGTTTLVRQAENLDRAPVAVATDDGVYVGWRLLGLDPADLGFYVYRDGVRVTKDPVTDTTNVLDPAGTVDSTYRIASVTGGVQTWVTESFGVWDSQTLDVALDKPADAYTKDGQPYTYRANDTSIGDVDGDGAYELIVKWDPSNSKDNSQAGYTGTVYVDAYELDGTRLWRIDLGANIRAGAHYTQFQVYDYDGDGRAEVAMKTADGTVDGQGTVIGDARADYRNSSGYVLTGPEYLTIFDGATGAAIDTVDYVPARGDVGSWGDTYGNRVDRFLAGTAYLDGEHPSLVMARGYYTRMVVATWDFDGSQLVQRWVFDTNEAGSQYEHQGNHQISVADVDGDQKDEIVYGSLTVDDDGEVLYSTGLGHGDALTVTDLDPSREGLEVFAVHEGPSGNGGIISSFRDAATGEILWSVSGTKDTGRGTAADIDPRYEGAEAWNIADGGAWNDVAGFLHAADGELISNEIPAANFTTWWDGDLLREVTDHDWDEATRTGVPTISKWDYENEQSVEIYRAEGTLTSNDTKGNPALQADLFGDWREEIVTRTDDSTALRIATTVDLTSHRLRTLQSDPVYRLSVAWQNTAYNQPPQTSYFLGEGMATPPTPSIAYVGDGAGTPSPVTSPTVVITSGGGTATTADTVTVTGTAQPGDTGWKEDKALVYAELQNAAGKKVLGQSVPVTDGAWTTTFTLSSLPVGEYRIKVSASSKGMGNGSDTEALTVTAPRVPGPATAAPARGVLSSDNWDGDGDFALTMTMWWGQNAWSVDLFQDGVLVASKDLTDATPSAQQATFPIAGLRNGTYVFTAVLSNQHGQTTTAPLTVQVTTANPGAPVLSSDNWDGDGSYTVTTSMWWGTNATSYRLYENGVLVDTRALVPNGRNAQIVHSTLTGRAPGTYTYTAVLANAAGETTSQPLQVRVTR